MESMKQQVLAGQLFDLIHDLVGAGNRSDELKREMNSAIPVIRKLIATTRKFVNENV